MLIFFSEIVDTFWQFIVIDDSKVLLSMIFLAIESPFSNLRNVDEDLFKYLVEIAPILNFSCALAYISFF